MKINIYIKHLIIPIVVVTITLSVIFFGEFVAYGEAKYRVSFLFSENNVSTEGPEQIVYNSLKEVQNTNEALYINEENNKNLISVDFYRSSSSGDAQAKLDIQLANSDILFIYGNEYNDFVNDAIKSSPKKTFFIVDSSKEFIGNNVTNISLDQSYIYEDAFKSMSEETQTEKILFVSSIKQSKHPFFNEVFVSDNIEIEYVYISDPENNSDISNQINTALDKGCDQIFIDDITINNYAISVVSNYRASIVENDSAILTINESIEEQRNKITPDLSEDEVSSINSKIEELEQQIDDKYEQTNIDMYVKGYDYSQQGLFVDVYGEEKSVVDTSYVIDPFSVINKQINSVISNTYQSSNIVVNNKNGIRKVKNEN